MKRSPWLRWEEEESIHHLFLTFTASFEAIEQLFGEIPETYLIFQKRTAIWAVRWRDIYRIGDALLRLYKDKSVQERFWQGFQRVTAKLTRFLGRLNKKHLRKLPRQKLLGTHSKFTALYQDFWRLGWFFEEVTLSIERKEDRRKQLNQLLETVGFWQEYRKKHALLASHHLERILFEIGKRFGLSQNAMMYTFPFEIEGITKGRVKTLRKHITERRQSCVLYWKGENVVSIAENQDAKTLEQQLFVTMLMTSRKKINGVCVFSGNVTGKAFIVRTQKDTANFLKHSVALVPHVTPKHFVLFRKAKAIVTDWGGVTSHAAVMAREFRLPTIVGTKVATLLFKNGDWVEVNADEGFVRKL